MSATTCTKMVVDETLPGKGTYTGRLVNGKRDGSGTCSWPEGTSYDGEWKDDKRQGRGAYKWPSGSTYEGEYHNDKRDGWGVQHFPDGSWYEGLWRDGRWVRGTWHNSNNVDVQSGEWMETTTGYSMQGWGVQSRQVKRVGGGGDTRETVYEGEWDRDKWHGSGTWTPDGSGDIYHGQFDHGKKRGNGSMLFESGGSYVGEWKDDMFHGWGVRLSANGDRYEGHWVRGNVNGEGTKMLACDGSSFTGLWEMGAPKKGTMRWPNGDMFEGTFTHGGDWELQGEGVATLPSSEGRNMVQVRGILNSNNMFQQHKMGAPPFEIIEALNADKKQLQLRIEQLIKEIEELKAHIKQLQLRIDELTKEIEKLKAHIKQLQLHIDELTKEIERLNAANKQLQLCIEQLTKEIKAQLQKQLQKYEDEAQLLPLKESSGNKTNSMEATTAPVLPELMETFKLAAQLRTQLKESAPEFVLLEESLNEITRSLQGATQHNEGLTSHLRDLAALKDTLGKQLDETCNTCKKDTLGKQLDETCNTCKKVLGQTLTAQNSEAEIQQCSRNISELTKKMLGVKPVDGIVLEPSPPEGTENLLKPTPEYILTGGSKTTTQVEPFHFLATLTDTLTQLQGCRFGECAKLADQHTTLSKELSEQFTLGQNLHKQIEEMQVSCSELMREHKTKWVLMRGLEGDEQFISLPCRF
ncbi:MORN motif precursor [Pelomyxa schiedti]|nr:MORN motif precursor [Pelomyxa schiedti]